MTRPDPRLLVPVSALPFVPEGARYWIGADPDGDESFVADGSETARGLHHSPRFFLDASAPDLRDGLLVRLDALPWLLKVLGWPSAGFVNGAGTLTVSGRLVVGPVRKGYVTHVVQPWPDLTNLTPDEAARAVVVAAIVARGAK